MSILRHKLQERQLVQTVPDRANLQWMRAALQAWLLIFRHI